jgi:hypothetical protein
MVPYGLLLQTEYAVKDKTHTYENKVRQIVKNSHILIKNGKPYMYLIHS